jgi:hypothetical protein
MQSKTGAARLEESEECTRRTRRGAAPGSSSTLPDACGLEHPPAAGGSRCAPAPSPRRGASTPRGASISRLRSLKTSCHAALPDAKLRLHVRVFLWHAGAPPHALCIQRCCHPSTPSAGPAGRRLYSSSAGPAGRRHCCACAGPAGRRLYSSSAGPAGRRLQPPPCPCCRACCCSGHPALCLPRRCCLHLHHALLCRLFAPRGGRPRRGRRAAGRARGGAGLPAH